MSIRQIIEAGAKTREAQNDYDQALCTMRMLAHLVGFDMLDNGCAKRGNPLPHALTASECQGMTTFKLESLLDPAIFLHKVEKISNYLRNGLQNVPVDVSITQGRGSTSAEFIIKTNVALKVARYAVSLAKDDLHLECGVFNPAVAGSGRSPIR